MRKSDLPPTLARRWANLPDIYQRGPHEWSSSLCPQCGSGNHQHGTGDRFRMFDDGKPRCYCRHCGYTDFADSDNRTFVVTDEMKRQWLEERERREREELQRTQHALELLRKERAYIEWHNMIRQCGRNWWHSKGVSDYMIDLLKLGYCASKTVWYGDHQQCVTATATIPVFGPGWELMNVRHRLINPPEPNDKYRPDRAGLPASLYLTNPNDKPAGECILIEGEIKSIVVYDRIEPDRMYIVGLPGKSPSFKLLDSLSECDRVHIILDPDATDRAYSIAEYLGKKRARIISLPVKADDFFTLYGGTVSDFESAIKAGMKL